MEVGERVAGVVGGALQALGGRLGETMDAEVDWFRWSAGGNLRFRW